MYLFSHSLISFFIFIISFLLLFWRTNLYIYIFSGLEVEILSLIFSSFCFLLYAFIVLNYFLSTTLKLYDSVLICYIVTIIQFKYILIFILLLCWLIDYLEKDDIISKQLRVYQFSLLSDFKANSNVDRKHILYGFTPWNLLNLDYDPLYDQFWLMFHATLKIMWILQVLGLAFPYFN